MTILAHLAATAGSLVKLATLPAGIVLVSRLLLQRLDDRGLFKVQPFPWMPFVAAAALEWLLLRTSGLAPALDPLRLWTEGVWAVNLVALYTRHLAPSVLLTQASAAVMALAAAPGEHVVTSAVLLSAYGTLGVAAALAWRSIAVWRGLFLQLWLTVAVWLLLHYAIVLVYWTMHWLNFWVFLMLLGFVQMRRKEGPRDTTSPS